MSHSMSPCGSAERAFRSRCFHMILLKQDSVCSSGGIKLNSIVNIQSIRLLSRKSFGNNLVTP